MPGSLLDNRFELINIIGRGTLGTVYEARNCELNTKVAIKIVNPVDENQHKVLRRFARGMKAAAALNHHNVSVILEYGFFDERSPYYVMEYLQGTLLDALISKRRFLTLPEALPIAMQICDALDHAHSVGVVHRNLKPANIMLVVDDHPIPLVKVLDFGLSKSYFRIDEPDANELTSPGELLGTPEFISPEQCSEKPVDWRSDIYSTGCLIFTMLTGRPPHLGATSYETIMKQVSQPPMPFLEACPEANVPQTVQKVIFKALEKDPDARQQTMMLLKEELMAAAAKSVPLVSRPAPEKKPVPASSAEVPPADATPSTPFTTIARTSAQFQRPLSDLTPTNTMPIADITQGPAAKLSKNETAHTPSPAVNTKAPSAPPSSDEIRNTTGQHSVAQSPKTAPAGPVPTSDPNRTQPPNMPLPEFSMPMEPAESLVHKINELCLRHLSVDSVLLTEVLERRGNNQGKAELVVIVQINSPLRVTVRDLMSEKLDRAVSSHYKGGGSNIIFTGDGPQLARVRANSRFLFKR